MLVNTNETEKEQREEVIARAKECLKTPFHDNQSLKGAGMDCLGLLLYAYREVVRNISVPRYTSQHMLHHDEEKYMNNIVKYCTEVKEPKLGDIALFKFGKCYSHSAIVIDWPRLTIHSYVGRGVEFCNPSIDGAFRHRWEHARFFDPFGGIA